MAHHSTVSLHPSVFHHSLLTHHPAMPHHPMAVPPAVAPTSNPVSNGQSVPGSGFCGLPTLLQRIYPSVGSERSSIPLGNLIQDGLGIRFWIRPESVKFDLLCNKGSDQLSVVSPEIPTHFLKLGLLLRSEGKPLALSAASTTSGPVPLCPGSEPAS